MFREILKLALLFITSTSVALISAQTTHNVLVGADDSLTFSPDYTTANVNDTIAFSFVSGNHTVTQSTFESPCTNFSNSGIDSGFVPVPNNVTSLPQFLYTLTTSNPLWFYCRQTGHCGKGMVFAINPTVNESFIAFQYAANATSASPLLPGAPNVVIGQPAVTNLDLHKKILIGATIGGFFGVVVLALAFIYFQLWRRRRERERLAMSEPKSETLSGVDWQAVIDPSSERTSRR